MAAFQVTLTTADTNYDLLTLCRAIDANLVDGFSHIVIQSDANNGAAKVKVGKDSSLSNTRFGYELGAGEGHVYPGNSRKRYGLYGLVARTDTNGSKLNLELTR
jgi:hypothetical protein